MNKNVNVQSYLRKVVNNGEVFKLTIKFQLKLSFPNLKHN